MLYVRLPEKVMLKCSCNVPNIILEGRKTTSKNKRLPPRLINVGKMSEKYHGLITTCILTDDSYENIDK